MSESRSDHHKFNVGFEDFYEGLTFRTTSLTITETHIVLWAGLTGDWYPLHMDDEFSQNEGPFGQRVAHGPLVFAFGVGLMSQAGIFGNAILAWLGCEQLTANEPVFVGDTISLAATVRSSRPSQSDPSKGIVSFQYETLNQHERTVMSCVFNLMMRSKQHAQLH